MMERQEQILQAGKALMEPVFMRQLPDLMKQYKENEEEILTGLCEKIERLFTKAEEMQAVGKRKSISLMTISYLQSSTLTGNYELRLDLYDEDFYLNEAECCVYWEPEFITGYLRGDEAYLKHNIGSNVPRVKTYELQQFMDGYALNYRFLLAQFFQQMLPSLWERMKSSLSGNKEEKFLVLFGEYMGKGMVVMGEKSE